MKVLWHASLKSMPRLILGGAGLALVLFGISGCGGGGNSAATGGNTGGDNTAPGGGNFGGGGGAGNNSGGSGNNAGGTVTYSRSVSTIDTAGNPVAIYNFTQTTTGSASTVALQITNASGRALCVPYTILFNLNGATWQSDDSLDNLQPGASISKGIIATNPARIDVGTLQVLYNSDPDVGCAVQNPAFAGRWTGTFSVPANSALGSPATTGTVFFNTASNGAIGIRLSSSEFTTFATGTIDQQGQFSGMGQWKAALSGAFTMTGQVTLNSVNSLTFTLTAHSGGNAARDLTYTGSAQLQ